MSESAPRPPAAWVLNEKTRATVLDFSEGRTDILIERLQGPGACVLSITADGRMLTNNQDVDVSDDFPAYLGYFDIFSEMGEHVQPGTSVIMDEENLVSEPDESLMGLLYQIDVLARRMTGMVEPAEALRYIREMLETLETGDRAEKSYPIPYEGTLQELEVRMLQKLVGTVLEFSADDILWDGEWNERVQITPDNHWVLPGTFGSDRGTWEITPGKVVIKVDDPDA